MDRGGSRTSVCGGMKARRPSEQCRCKIASKQMTDNVSSPLQPIEKNREHNTYKMPKLKTNIVKIFFASAICRLAVIFTPHAATTISIPRPTTYIAVHNTNWSSMLISLRSSSLDLMIAHIAILSDWKPECGTGQTIEGDAQH